MMSFTKLLRRTAAALGAIAALTATGVATAQTVTLIGTTGNTCTYSTVQGSGGNFNFTCGSTTSPGTLAVAGPSSLATGTNYTTQIGVSRTSGSTGAASVHWAVTGTNNCVSSDGTSTITSGDASWADGESQTRLIPIATGPLSGTCIITLSAETGASVGTASRIKTMNVVNGNDPVTFTLAATTGSTTVQGSAVSITVNRAGGPSNDWTVPVTLAGNLAPAGTLLAGSLSKTSLSFPAGSSSDTIVYTPPATTPATPALPNSFQLILGAPQGPVPTGSGQTGSISGTNTHTLTLNPAPVQGCGTPLATDPVLGIGDTPTIQMASGQVTSYVMGMVSAQRKYSGRLIVSSTSSSISDSYTGPFSVEVHLSKCKGVVTATNDHCYAIGSISKAQPISAFYWVFQLVNIATPQAVNNAGACYSPASEGPWYINVRYTYGAGACASTNCGYKMTPYLWSY